MDREKIFDRIEALEKANLDLDIRLSTLRDACAGFSENQLRVIVPNLTEQLSAFEAKIQEHNQIIAELLSDLDSQ